MTIQSDGKIAVSGQSNINGLSYCPVARSTSCGALDLSLDGQDGKPFWQPRLTTITPFRKA